MIIFKNLLTDEEDFCYGVLLKDETVYCLCGCGSIFEKGDYAIISAKADAASNIPYQRALAVRKELFFDMILGFNNQIKKYGYSWKGMHGITAEIGKLLYQYNIETYRLYEDGTEGAVENFSEFDGHDGWFGVEVATLEQAIEKGILNDFFFENWDEEIKPISKAFNTYIVCMNSEYVRDAQMLNTTEMKSEEFENIDWQSSELDEFWHDMEPTPFIGVVEAESEENALAIAASKYRYDERCLYVAKEIRHISKTKVFYTLTVMTLSDGEFDLSTRVFNTFKIAQKEFDLAIEYQKKHTWISDYRVEQIDENDDSCDENRVLETLYFPDKDTLENINWEAYRDGYCSSMHTIIKLEKQINTKEAKNA